MASVPPEAAFVLVHGAWHGAWTYERVIPLLARGGPRRSRAICRRTVSSLAAIPIDGLRGHHLRTRRCPRHA